MLAAILRLFTDKDEPFSQNKRKTSKENRQNTPYLEVTIIKLFIYKFLFSIYFANCFCNFYLINCLICKLYLYENS